MKYKIDSTSLTAIADAIREKTGKSALMTPTEMPDEIASISGGGDSDKWVRPSNYPDLDNIVLPNFLCTYLTYDLSKCNNPEDAFISICFRGDTTANLIAERGHLTASGEFVADKTYKSNDHWSSWTFFETLDAQYGTVQLWRIRQTDDTKQPQFAFYGYNGALGTSSTVQPCVEILHYAPSGTKFSTFGNGGVGKTFNLLSVKIISEDTTMSAYNTWSGAYNLRRFIIDTKNGSFADARNMIYYCINLIEVDFGNASFLTSNGLLQVQHCVSLRKLIFPTSLRVNAPTNVVGTCHKLEYLDLNNVDVSGVTNLQNGFIQNLYSLKELHMEDLDFDADTSTSVFNAVSHIPRLEELYPPKIYRSQTWDMPTLSHDSLVRLFNTLPETESSKTVTIGSYNQSKLTAAEIAIATGKGWTVA